MKCPVQIQVRANRPKSLGIQLVPIKPWADVNGSEGWVIFDVLRRGERTEVKWVLRQPTSHRYAVIAAGGKQVLSDLVVAGECRAC